MTLELGNHTSRDLLFIPISKLEMPTSKVKLNNSLYPQDMQYKWIYVALLCYALFAFLRQCEKVTKSKSFNNTV